MSSIRINRDTINKLTHDSIEIRLRTLEQVSSKLNRALELNGNVEFKPSELCKQLIRWFGYIPIQQPLKVLNLLKSIIESSRYGFKVINKLGSERLIKELRKIQSLFDIQSPEYNEIIKIRDALINYSLSMEKDKIEKNAPLETIIELCDDIKIEEQNVYSIEDYEIPWSQPSPSDYTSMKFLSDILINKCATSEEIDSALCHLQITMVDYPAEHLLQAPHIFQNLLQLCDERKNTENKKVSIDNVASSMLEFLFILERRIKMSRKLFNLRTNFNENKCAKQKSSKTPRQLKIEKALREIFDASVYHLELYAPHGKVSPVVWNVIFKVLKILENIKKSVDVLCLYKLASIIANISKKFTDTQNCARIRLHQQLLILLLQDIVQMDGSKNSSAALDVFEPILRDYTMKSFFSKRHQVIEAFVIDADKSMKEKHQLLKLYEKSFEIATKMLKNDLNWSCSEIIKEGNLVCKVLDYLQSKELTDVLFNGVIKGIHLYRANNEIKEQAIDLLLMLLNVTFMPLKIYVYNKITDAFKRHIGCLMSGERYALECSNEDLIKEKIVGVPLNSELLVQLVHDMFETASDRIKSNCSKIFELLLKSRNLFGTHWYSLLPIVVPLLPLLNCSTFSKEIMDLLLKLLDPDLKQLPFVCMLQGNIVFLFHSNANRRSEALNRLIYTINSLKGCEKYMPNLLEVADSLPDDICIQNTPQDYKNIFSDSLPVRSDLVNSLNNLLHILETPDVEPLIRKTTLMQVNVLCKNWRIIAELCSLGDFYLILQTLENGLQKSSEVDFADAVVPAISILSKVMIYDSSVRRELAETPNIYVLLLRALLMFHHDIQVRQDASLCLFLLLFASHIVATESSIEGPILLSNIKTPVKITYKHSALCSKIQQESIKLSRIFASVLEETEYWRMVVASSYCGGLKNITENSPSVLSKLDINNDLKLTNFDVRFIRATQPNVSLLRLVRAAVNATDHRSLIQACQLIKQQLIVPSFKYTFSVNTNFCEEINGIFRRYLRMPPGNGNDLDLYEHLLDVAKICLNIPLELVADEIFKILYKDPCHALITMLTQSEEIPLRVYNKIITLLRLLITEHQHVLETNCEASECSCFYSNLFKSLIERCLKLFEIRDLQRVRCLFSLVVAISSCQLNTHMSDQLLFFYCRRFLQLSLALKSFTQTGAQWHRYCLLIILRLSNQMQNTKESFRLTAGCIKYLSGLCGHIDMEVRTLAWSILNITAKTKAIDNTVTERKSDDLSGTELLINELSYLPGGFMACCLSTFLDFDEAISIRNLAGQLLAVLIREQGQVEKIEKLLEDYGFTRSAVESLTMCVCVLEAEITMDLDMSTTNVTTCDLISCYSLICISLSQRSPAFLNELCTKSFMFKLYEILKQPPPISNHVGYINMIGHICRLYTLCYNGNFDFLKRTICHDAVWLQSFCQILFKVVAQFNDIYNTFNMLQLLLILCKDSLALEQLSIKLRNYSIDLVVLFKNTLNVKNIRTSLQSCSLALLSLLLIKSQPEIEPCSSHVFALLESENCSIKPTSNEIYECENKENGISNKKDKNNEKIELLNDESNKSSISEQCCVLLIRLFEHLYPVNMCKFSLPPNLNQQHVTETLALLLKQSPIAQETAQNLKFQEKVIKIFKYFFDEFAATSCTAYLKRNGMSKKLAVIKNLQLLLKLLLSWHSSPSMIITDNVLAMDYSKIIIQIWSWLAHSNDLKLTTLKVSSFLSERSLVVCKQFSSLNNSSFSHSVLQLVTKMITGETLKVKANSIDCNPVITAGLRVLINCCSCLEGRNALNKLHVLDVFDTIYPFNPKASQIKRDIVNAWLEFWELFSRYDEGAQSHHLNALCSVVNKSPPGCSTRLLSLQILRNMAFLNSNRSTLITSTDFMFTVTAIVSQPIKESVEEQFTICVALWKLISGGIKFVAIIRGTKLAKNLQLLREKLKCTKDENDEAVTFSNDLLNVLDIIFNIFNN